MFVCDHNNIFNGFKELFLFSGITLKDKFRHYSRLIRQSPRRKRKEKKRTECDQTRQHLTAYSTNAVVSRSYDPFGQ